MLLESATARLSLAAAAACISLAACGGGNDPAASAPVAAASSPAIGIKTITINPTTDPALPSQDVTFDGTTFGPVGTYRKIVGTATGTLDPADPHNAMITDIQLAPKNADGLVEYSLDFYILTPSDPTKGNRKVLHRAAQPGRQAVRPLQRLERRQRPDDRRQRRHRVPDEPGLHDGLGRMGAGGVAQ